jgi:ATP/maltotriose-dependent transcriptional regulator MalT
MKLVFLDSKLHIPHTRFAVVQRDTLMEQVNEGMKTRLTLVTAQAG